MERIGPEGGGKVGRLLTLFGEKALQFFAYDDRNHAAIICSKRKKKVVVATSRQSDIIVVVVG